MLSCVNLMRCTEFNRTFRAKSLFYRKYLFAFRSHPKSACQLIEKGHPMKNQSLSKESELRIKPTAAVRIPDQESELANRLRDAIGDESVVAFGRRCGINESTLRKYFYGTLPNIENLVAIADAANVTIEWLAAGRGPKQRGASASAAPALPASGSNDFAETDLDRLTTAIEAVEEGLARIGSQLSADKRAKLIAAAYDILEEDDQKENIIKFIKLAA
ncbi:MAG: helix-turn-helix domain-containing protein [Rhodoferax sp.]